MYFIIYCNHQKAVLAEASQPLRSKLKKSKQICKKMLRDTFESFLSALLASLICSELVIKMSNSNALQGAAKRSPV